MLVSVSTVSIPTPNLDPPQGWRAHVLRAVPWSAKPLWGAEESAHPRDWFKEQWAHLTPFLTVPFRLRRCAVPDHFSTLQRAPINLFSAKILCFPKHVLVKYMCTVVEDSWGPSGEHWWQGGLVLVPGMLLELWAAGWYQECPWPPKTSRLLCSVNLKMWRPYLLLVSECQKPRLIANQLRHSESCRGSKLDKARTFLGWMCCLKGSVKERIFPLFHWRVNGVYISVYFSPMLKTTGLLVVNSWQCSLSSPSTTSLFHHGNVQTGLWFLAMHPW